MLYPCPAARARGATFYSRADFLGTAINASHSLFNIEPLKPLIEAGFFLLTPNFRLARRIKTVWDANQIAAGKRVWVPLRVMPLEGWLLEQCAQAVELGLLEPETTLDEGRALELWQQVIEQHQSNSGKYSLLRPAAAAAMASQARETLLRWQVDVDAAPIRQEFMLDDDCSTYLAWQDLFQARLRDQRLGTSACRSSMVFWSRATGWTKRLLKCAATCIRLGH